MGDPIEIAALTEAYQRLRFVSESLRPGRDQDQHRPPRRGRRRHRADQGGARARASRAAADPPLLAAQPADRLRVEPFLRQHRAPGVPAERQPAAGRSVVVRHRRHQRPRRAGGGSRPGAERSFAPGPAGGGFGQVRGRARGGHRPSRRPPRASTRAAAGRRSLHAAMRPAPLSPSAHARRSRPGGSHRGLAQSGRDNGDPREHRSRPPGRLPLSRPGRTTGRHGGRADGGAGVRRGDRAGERRPRPGAGLRPGAAARGRRPGLGRGSPTARGHGHRSARPLRRRGGLGRAASENGESSREPCSGTAWASTPRPAGQACSPSPTGCGWYEPGVS